MKKIILMLMVVSTTYAMAGKQEVSLQTGYNVSDAEFTDTADFGLNYGTYFKNPKFSERKIGWQVGLSFLEGVNFKQTVKSKSGRSCKEKVDPCQTSSDVSTQTKQETQIQETVVVPSKKSVGASKKMSNDRYRLHVGLTKEYSYKVTGKTVFFSLVGVGYEYNTEVDDDVFVMAEVGVKYPVYKNFSLGVGQSYLYSFDKQENTSVTNLKVFYNF
jgi:hypothetical protein